MDAASLGGASPPLVPERRTPYTQGMEPQRRSRLSDGRVLVSVFLGLMAVLFALSAFVFEPSPPRYTILAVAGVMLVGSLGGFVLAARAKRS